MNVTYILLSPTFGMHQYTADLANRIAATGNWKLEAGNHEPPASTFQPSAVRLVTTATLPRDRYSPAVEIHTPVTTHGTGFSRDGLNLAAYRRVLRTLLNLQPETCPPATCPPATCQPATCPPATCYHFTGVHLWNLPLVYELRWRGVPVVHTLHDLDPHHGVRFGGLIRLWNRLIIGSGCHILVHGRYYRDRLIAEGVPPDRITCTPLLHGFLSAAHPWPPKQSGVRVQESEVRGQGPEDIAHSRFNIRDATFDIPPSTSDIPHSTSFTVLFFGRVEAYKGVDVLLEAWKMLKENAGEKYSVKREVREAREFRLIIAGPVAAGVMLPPLPPDVELRDRRIMDDEADALFRSADVLVLPYRDATQSALVAAAYAYGLPVIVTRAGALPEYVVEGETGWIVPPEDPAALARALFDAWADPDCTRNMGEAGRSWFDAWRRREEAVLDAMYRNMSCES